MRLDELAMRIGAEVVGNGGLEISNVNTLEQAQTGDVSFLANARYTRQLDSTGATAVIVGPEVRSDHVALLRHRNPYYGFCQAMIVLRGHRRHPESLGREHSQASIDPTARVGAGCIIYPGVYIGPRVVIGDGCIIYPNVSIYDDSQLGNRVILQAGVVIGTDGYGFAFHQGAHHKIPQMGDVVIEDDVEIGSNSVIARGAIGTTRIGAGTKIDALVMVGHGVQIGAHSLLVAQTGIAGSTTIGHHATIAGQVGVAGHLKIGNAVTIAGRAGVMDDVADGQTLMGMPAIPASQYRKVLTLQLQLPTIRQRMRDMEQKIAQLESALSAMTSPNTSQSPDAISKTSRPTQSASGKNQNQANRSDE